MGEASSAQEVPEGFRVLQEGKARILQKGNDVFYNEAQVTNRDLSVAVLRSFLPNLHKELAEGALRKHRAKSKNAPGAPPTLAEPPQRAASPAAAENAAPAGVRILEGLAASGLRSIRYALETEGLVRRVDACDLDPAVAEQMGRNIEFNGPEALQRVKAVNSDVRLLMLTHPQTYDVIDLDPYGTPAHLLDSAVQAVSDGGLLMITATDMAVLCGNSGEVCWTKYGCYPLHRPYCHEMALRILLASVESHANRYKRYITPLLSLSVDFYVRVFVRVHTSAATVKESAGKLAYVFQSQGCDSFFLQRVGQRTMRNNNIKHLPGNGPVVPQTCPETGSSFLMGGPLWAEPIHDASFVQQLLSQLDAKRTDYTQHARIRGLLTSVSEELMDVPLYYNLHDVCKTLHCTPPKAQMLRSALLNAGYRVSGSHANPLAIKTDAPPAVLWDILRCWVKEHPVSRLDPESYAARLLAKEPQLLASFKRAAGSMPKSKESGVTRFVQNPAFWGPKSRHGRPAIQRTAAQEAGGGKRSRQRNRGRQADSDGGEGGQQQEDEAEQDEEQGEHGQQTAEAGVDGQQQPPQVPRACGVNGDSGGAGVSGAAGGGAPADGDGGGSGKAVPAVVVVPAGPGGEGSAASTGSPAAKKPRVLQPAGA